MSGAASTVLRSREPSGATPDRSFRRRVSEAATQGLSSEILAAADSEVYSAYDRQLVVRALAAGSEPWEGALCATCAQFTGHGEICCLPSMVDGLCFCQFTLNLCQAVTRLMSSYVDLRQTRLVVGPGLAVGVRLS